MENLRKAKLSTLPFEIATQFWPQIKRKAVGDKVVCDISNFRLSLEKIVVNIIDEETTPPSAKIADGAISCNNLNAGSFAHECCHLIAGTRAAIKKEDQLTTPILEESKSKGYKNRIIEYVNSPLRKNYERLIAYLYLADEEELNAKLTGFYVGYMLGNTPTVADDKFITGVLELYKNMSNFHITTQDLETDHSQMIRKYIERNPELKIDFNSPKSINDYIQKQGKTFVDKYKVLFH